jgi:hypothetical protein
MKILSDNAITKTDLTAVDMKQTQQIKRLTYWLAAVAMSNAVGFIAMWVLK